MQHSILFKNPGYYSAFPLILSNSNSKISAIFVSSPFHDHFGENFACVETKDFGRSWATIIGPKEINNESTFDGDIFDWRLFTAKSGWRAFTNKLPNGDLISAGSTGWEKLDIDQKNIALFESKIIEKCKSEKPEILDNISNTGQLDENTEKMLTQVISELKQNFKS